MKTYPQFAIHRFQFKGWELVTDSGTREFNSGDDAVAAWLKAKRDKGRRFATLWGVTQAGHRQMLKDWVK